MGNFDRADLSQNFIRGQPKALWPTLLIVFWLLFVSACFAEELAQKHLPPTPPKLLCLNDGFYAGVSGGYSWNAIQRNEHASILGDPLFSEKSFVNPAGFTGTLFMGYGYYFKGLYYLGAEGFGNLTGASETINTDFFGTLGEYTYHTRTSTDYSYGASLLSGYKVSDLTLIYMRFGFVQERFKEEERESLLSAPNGKPFLESNTHYFANGFSYGFGFEQALYSRLSFRGEFTHTSFQSFTNTYTSFVSATTAKLQPSNNQILFGLIWHIW